MALVEWLASAVGRTVLAAVIFGILEEEVYT